MTNQIWYFHIIYQQICFPFMYTEDWLKTFIHVQPITKQTLKQGIAWHYYDTNAVLGTFLHWIHFQINLTQAGHLTCVECCIELFLTLVYTF